MRKSVNYHVTCRIKHEGEVETCSCECPGGQSPACCKHVFALLAAVEDCSRRELYAAPTEKLQIWHQPRPFKVSPKKLTAEQPVNKDAADKTVDMSSLAALPNTAAIWNVINTGSATLASDTIYYEKTLSLPAFVTSQLSSSCAESLTVDYDTLMFYFNHVTGMSFVAQGEEEKTHCITTSHHSSYYRCEQLMSYSTCQTGQKT